MDPAALGTLIIGLEAIEAEQSADQRRRPNGRTRHATQRRASRALLAAALRSIADRLERPATQAAPG
jgi:hypothetical protein